VGGPWGALVASTWAPTATPPAGLSPSPRQPDHPLSGMLAGLWPLWGLLGLMALASVVYVWKVRRPGRAGLLL
jgi:hypothetical protein